MRSLREGRDGSAILGLEPISAVSPVWRTLSMPRTRVAGCSAVRPRRNDRSRDGATTCPSRTPAEEDLHDDRLAEPLRLGPACRRPLIGPPPVCPGAACLVASSGSAVRRGPLSRPTTNAQLSTAGLAAPVPGWSRAASPRRPSTRQWLAVIGGGLVVAWHPARRRLHLRSRGLRPVVSSPRSRWSRPASSWAAVATVFARHLA